jgi:uncharacterized damage-inducible protein DinB
MLTFRKKNTEISILIGQFKELYGEGAWHGKGIKILFDEINPNNVFNKPQGQHSIVELVWHMVNWKEFGVSRLLTDSRDLQYFEDFDWRVLDLNDKSLWEKGVNRFWEVHEQFIKLLQDQEDKLLDQIVEERNYHYRKLLNGLKEHDLYHSGQIAYINNLLKERKI